MKKIKTYITGLDQLLHGGLQIDSLTHSGCQDKDSLNSLVIVIRGKKGVSKHLFAMHLMHGIARSLRGLRSKTVNSPSAFYYSLNKTTEKLEDSYLDYLISKCLNFMTNENRREKLGYSVVKDKNDSKAIKRKIYEFLFDANRTKEGVYDKCNSDLRFYANKYQENVIDFLVDNILVYNPRTNALHYRRPFMGDAEENLWVVRNNDTIKDYLNEIHRNQKFWEDSQDRTACYLFNNFINVEFNSHLPDSIKNQNNSQFGDIGNMERYSKTANVIYEDILAHMEWVLNTSNGKRINTLPEAPESANEKWSDYEQPSCDNTSANNSPLYDVLVIDGFSQLDNDHLKSVQFSHLHRVARRMARVSILVLDEREEALCDGDIVIELQKNEDTRQEYTYRELQIVKSSFQDVAYGWHQYKIQTDGIKVFPSIHFLLSKRYYLQTKTHDIGQGILEESFEEFLDSKLHLDNCSNDKIGDEKNFLFSEYETDKEKHHKNRFLKILGNHRNWKVMLEAGRNDKEVEPLLHSYFSSIILGSNTSHGTKPDKLDGGNLSSWKEDCCSIPEYVCGWNKRYPTTVIVGNPNSFKRRLALGKAYHWAQQKEHVLIVLFGKNDDSLRKQLICPALHRSICSEINSCYFENRKSGYSLEAAFDEEVYRICSKCEKYLHFYRIRMGCITPDELFYRLEQQIKIYTNMDESTGIEKGRLHILIDDLQRVDFGFPFLDSTSLFTGALINLCHEHKVELTILCDKHSSRTKEVCALADNVVVLDRKENDINNALLFIEKSVEFPAPGAIMKFELGDVLNLFKCSELRNLTRDIPVNARESNNDEGEATECQNKKDDIEPSSAENKVLQGPHTGLTVDFSRINKSALCGSMRSFWRKTSNAVIKDRTDCLTDDNDKAIGN